MNSQMIPVWDQSGDSGGFPRSPSRSLWRRRRTRRGSCTGQTRGVGWLGWWKHLSVWFIFIPLIESGGKVIVTQKVVNPTLLVETGSDLPLSREKLTLAVPGWTFTFKENQIWTTRFLNLELNTTFIQITQPHCKRKSKSTRLVQNIGQFCLLMKPFSKHVNLLQSCKVKLRRSRTGIFLLEKAANLSAILPTMISRRRYFVQGRLVDKVEPHLRPFLQVLRDGDRHGRGQRTMEVLERLSYDIVSGVWFYWTRAWSLASATSNANIRYFGLHVWLGVW